MTFDLALKTNLTFPCVLLNAFVSAVSRVLVSSSMGNFGNATVFGVDIIYLAVRQRVVVGLRSPRAKRLAATFTLPPHRAHITFCLNIMDMAYP